MPYVTESAIVHILVPLSDDTHIAGAEKFLNAFAKNMMAKADKSDLTLLVPAKDYANLKTLADKLNGQHKKQGTKINILSHQGNSISPSHLDFVASDLLSAKLGPDQLIFLCNPFTELYPDVLNRVRINTISGWQLFNPVPFSEYNPDVSYFGLPKSEVFDVSTNQGFYDIYDSQHVSFYVADYMNGTYTH